MGYYLLTVVIGYLVGNLSPSYIIGKISENIDIRDYGSGNAGTTNTIRVLGAKAGVIVFLCDVMKGALATLIGLWLTGGDQLGAVLSGGMAVIGHNWPVLLRFKGGKGIASSFGLILVMFPKIGLILFLIGLDHPIRIFRLYQRCGIVSRSAGRIPGTARDHPDRGDTGTYCIVSAQRQYQAAAEWHGK